MNPKHFHTPVSTRLRCPICHQPVYSRGGIHPQCAMRQAEPALHEPEESLEIVAEDQKVAVPVVPAVAVPKIKTAVRPVSTSVAGAKARPVAAPVGAGKAGR